MALKQQQNDKDEKHQQKQHKFVSEQAEIDLPTSSSDNRWRQLLWLFLLSVVFRLFAAHFLTEFFQQNPLFSTPWSSLKRLREGLFLYRQHNSDHKTVYDGDLFHVLPIFIELFRSSLDKPLLLHFQWMVFDLLTAYYTSRFVKSYIASGQQSDFRRSQWLEVLAFGGYLLNPMTIGCWMVGSLSSFVNLLVAMSICFMMEGGVLRSVLPLALAIQLNPYYAIIFCPIFIRFTGSRRFAAIFYAILASIGFFLLNALLLMNRGSSDGSVPDMLRCTFGFFLTVPDLTPNTGIFWYFFTQVFEHYRMLFLCAFQLNAFIYVVPFAALLRENPSLLAVHFMLIVALFSPYPSYAETALYLPAMAAFFDLHKFLRQRLLVGCALLAIFVLGPIMWSMWVITGSGNANFFFAIVWVFNLTQVFVAADLLSAFLRERIVTSYGAGDQEEMERRFEGIRLISVSPF
uniref:GPI transamidase component PIG-U n=1 Tax=Globodera pallida TaxID=36090 RepID=A0A183C398_GLOPA